MIDTRYVDAGFERVVSGGFVMTSNLYKYESEIWLYENSDCLCE